MKGSHAAPAETGAARPMVLVASRAILVVVLAVVAGSLQGCDVPHVQGYVAFGDVQIASHSVPFWRTRMDYFDRFAHVAKGAHGLEKHWNSCMDPAVDQLSVCSGRGHCEPFDSEVRDPLLFCVCDTDWGGPECQTPRERQSIAWVLSLLFGPFGIDEIYLGWPVPAVCKIMITFFALAVWATGNQNLGIGIILVPWFYDVVRIGSAPVRSSNYHVAPDLPRWAFVILTISFFSFIAFIIGVTMVYNVVTHKRFARDMVKYYGSAGHWTTGGHIGV